MTKWVSLWRKQMTQSVCPWLVPHLCIRERSHMNGVLNEDGLDLRLQLTGPTQHPHTVAIGVERRAFPRVNANHHSVLLEGSNEGRDAREKQAHSSESARPPHLQYQSVVRGGSCWPAERQPAGCWCGSSGCDGPRAQPGCAGSSCSETERRPGLGRWPRSPSSSSAGPLPRGLPAGTAGG